MFGGLETVAGTSRKKQDTGSRKKQAGTTGTKRSGTGRKKTAPAVNENSFMGTEVAIIVSFAVSVLLFLSNFGLCGAVGDFCRKVMLGIFGSMGYAAPVLLFLGTCFYMSNRGNYRAFLKMGAVAVVLLALCGLDQMMFGGGMKEGWKLSQYYVQSGAGGDGGGFAGGALVMILSSALGSVGTYLVLIVALVLGAVCITEKSLVSLVKKGSGRAYEYAREDMNRRREIHEERREERRRMREEQRVRGVDLDATNLNDVPLMREFAAGIPEGTVLAEDAGQEFQEDDRQFQTDGKDREASAGRPQNPADIFRGSIALPQYDPEADMEEAEETGQAEAKAAASDETGKRRKSRKGSPQEDTDDILKNIYVRRDTRTFEEFSGEEREIGGRHPGFTAVPAEDYGETEVPWENTDARDVYDSDVRPEPFGEPYPEAGHFDDSEQVERFYEDCEGTEPYGSAKAYYREEDLSVNGSDSEQEEGLNYDGFYIPEEPKTVVTASGKIIETDTEMVRKTIEKKRVEKKSQPEDELSLNEQIEKRAEAAKVVKKEYIVPPLNLLKKGAKNSGGFSEKEYKETAIKLQQTLQNFGVGVTVTNISCGPSVTRYELHPEQGVKVSKIVALSDDIKLNLAAADIRIEAPIPGKAAVGIEVPNKENNVVLLRELLESEDFKRHGSHMAFAVGKDIGGQVVVTDIAKMPHLLIAGATGSGKSVCINTLIMSVIYKAKPDEVKLIMIDPKVVELSVYNGIPHLLIPVVTDPKKASGALNWAVAEMTDRYNKFAKYNVRDLKGYNAKIESIKDIDDDNKPEKLPQIIIIVDELADLMMVAPGEVEDSICRLAQLARAAGIHLVIATQRPSVNVITGLIKANIPSRIAFSVSSGVDSRTIIDMNGAEKLLGKGDMLFYPSGYQKPQRVQGAFVSDQEVSRVVEFLTEQGMTADYNPEVESKISTASFAEGPSGGSDRDAYFVQAGRFIIEKEKASIGMLQRMFKIGFNRAARIMDQLAEAGVVGEEEGTKPRKVLMTMEQFENMMNE
ncbi:FtsK/SpoIIIE family DNA translocase [[Clostridium] symbiosum]|uniref:FtsK/SpoIIIE family protein n=1 Tax=[Clostridium] symbiosum ATCC 14940 TaxID=411472 RepID=A0ABC9TQ82_CLOSY|nr:DNA translocase FtsK [[Clostridium] symbiosum]ERI73426.1 FtsK/SpoIIIE family protein [[Clostridium] symbiosum ATCC 14940]MDM8136853.1 DNA translocase FtsK [[Clostridium] symbiosum]MDM8141065.1 DNA translocase FtsK [[Clostridium] symbiosum]MDM8321024.1 DNA translocase FtsK [[Clostridium] symbiosum]